MPLSSRRPALLLAVGALLAAPSVVPVLTAGSAVGAPAPSPDCTDTFPLAAVTEQQPVHGLTVRHGTSPEPFTGTVLGVLTDGISPGIDMIVADLSSPAIDAAGGIWEGMSGSPVYADDGRLIGAVAYGLAYGSSPIAGITPFEAMDDHLDASLRSRRAALSGTVAERVARATGLTSAQAARGMVALPTPRVIAGVSSRLVRESAGRRPYLTSVHGVAGVSRAAAATDADIVAGGNVAVTDSYGDVTSGAVGTATYVCGDRVVGFGHPFEFGGPTELALNPAYAVLVQPDPLGVPFKVANIDAPVGTVTEDRMAGITGTFGSVPVATVVTSDVTYGDRHRVGVTDVYRQGSLPDLTYYANVNNLATTIDAEREGSQSQVWLIEGTDAAGAPFTLHFDNRYTTFDNLTEAPFYLSDLVYELTNMRGVTVTSVTNTIVASDDYTRLKLDHFQQWRGGAWHRVSDGAPIQGRAGGKVRIRAVVTGDESLRTLSFLVPLPKRVKGFDGTVRLAGGDFDGDGLYLRAGAGNPIAALQRRLDQTRRNDVVGGRVKLRSKKGAYETALTRAPLDAVIRGTITAKIKVR